MLWYFNRIQYLIDDIFRGDIFCFGFIGKADAVAHDVMGNGPDIFGDHISPALDEGKCFCGKGQVDAGTGGGAILDQRLKFLQLVFCREREAKTISVM